MRLFYFIPNILKLLNIFTTIFQSLFKSIKKFAFVFFTIVPSIVPSRRSNKKKGAAPAYWLPEAPPHTKGRATKTFSGMAGVGVGFHPEHGELEKGWGGFPGQAGSADTQDRAPQG